METAVISSSLNQKVRKDQSISAAPTELIDALELSPSGSEHDVERSQPKHRLVKSLHNDPEQLWVEKSEEMEKAVVLVKSR